MTAARTVATLMIILALAGPAATLFLSIGVFILVLNERHLAQRVACIVHALDDTDANNDAINIADLCPEAPR